MPAKVLFIGLDSMNPWLTLSWARRGELPNFAQLWERASAFRLRNSLGTLPGAIWNELPTGIWGHESGLYYNPLQFFPEEGIQRPVADSDIDPDDYVWNIAARAGRRCAVIDVPFMALSDRSSALQLREWAVHDHCNGLGSRPAGLAAELVQRFGALPASAMCDRLMPEMGRDRFAEALRARAEPKITFCEESLREGEWDLFYVVFGETHCATHHLWPKPGTRAGTDPFAASLAVYRKMDEMLGRLQAAAGARAEVVVTLSHGAGPYRGGPQMLSEVLRRLDFGGVRDDPLRRALRQVRRRLQQAPRPLQEIRRRLERLAPVKALGAAAGFPGRRIPAKVIAFAQPNNRCGAIWLNPAMRDHADSLLARIADELTALRLGKGGPPIVKRVIRSEAAFGPGRSRLVPDLLVEFVGHLGPIEQAWSPSVGMVRQPLRRSVSMRYGDHTPDNRTLVMAEGYVPGARLREGDIVDVAPTLLALLGLPVPASMSGGPLKNRLAKQRLGDDLHGVGSAD